MAMDMLRQLAGLPLPVTFRTSAEIDQVRLLRAAGLVIALTPDADTQALAQGIERSAQVLAITERGREELSRFELPDRASIFPFAPRPGWRSRLRAKATLRRGD